MEVPGPTLFVLPTLKCTTILTTPSRCTLLPAQCNLIPCAFFGQKFIDGSQCSSKGSNASISYLHHHFENYGLGEKDVRLHCNNCSAPPNQQDTEKKKLVEGESAPECGIDAPPVPALFIYLFFYLFFLISE